MRVVLDAGHGLRADGTFDPGALSRDRMLCEHDLAMYTATLIREKCRRYIGNFSIITGPATFNERSGAARDADIFLSIHFNAFDGSTQGTEVLYHEKVHTKADKMLAQSLQAALCDRLKFKDRGIKPADLAVLRRKDEKVAGVLIEPFFIDAVSSELAYYLAGETAEAVFNVLWAYSTMEKRNG